MRAPRSSPVGGPPQAICLWRIVEGQAASPRSPVRRTRPRVRQRPDTTAPSRGKESETPESPLRGSRSGSLRRTTSVTHAIRARTSTQQAALGSVAPDLPETPKLPRPDFPSPSACTLYRVPFPPDLSPFVKMASRQGISPNDPTWHGLCFFSSQIKPSSITRDVWHVFDSGRG